MRDKISPLLLCALPAAFRAEAESAGGSSVAKLVLGMLLGLGDNSRLFSKGEEGEIKGSVSCKTCGKVSAKL